jgi:hypothetical protein
VQVAAQGARLGKVDGLQRESFDGGGDDGGFGRPPAQDRRLGDAGRRTSGAKPGSTDWRGWVA